MTSLFVRMDAYINRFDYKNGWSYKTDWTVRIDSIRQVWLLKNGLSLYETDVPTG